MLLFLKSEMSSKKRSVGEQIRSGFVIAGELVGGFVVCVIALSSLETVFAKATTPPSKASPLVWPALAAATTVIFVTAERWGGFVPGFLFLFAAFKGFAYSVIPPVANHDRTALTRSEYLGMGCYSVLVIVLLWRFIPPRKTQATILDRVALTVFALSVLTAMVLQEPTSLILAVAGLVALIVPWTIYFWFRKKSHHQRHRNPQASGVLPTPD